jgi:phospholipid/cholesterol/gamma-HCH transport system substrate-binding protein
VKRAIRTHARDFAAIIALSIVSIAVGAYILSNQRLRFPFIEEQPTRIKAEFSTAQAITPGQGQTVRVSGVKIGDIGKVELREGRAVVTFEILPKFKDLLHEDATALLRPKTALKDMFVEVQPGSSKAPVAKEGYTIPVSNTLPDINPDEFLAALDADTRDYLKLLIGGAAQGLANRGEDLREVFKRFEPTHRDLARVNGKVAERRENLRRLIHNLNVINTELATKDDELAQLVDASARVFRAYASQGPNITQTVRELPSALRQTTQTLQRVEAFARVLRPSLDQLTPAVSQIDEANAALEPLARRPRRSCATRSGPSCARRGRSCATCARPRRVWRTRPPTCGGSSPCSTASSTSRPTTRTAARDRATPTARRATCSGRRGWPTTAARCSRPPTPTASSARRRCRPAARPSSRRSPRSPRPSSSRA